MKNGSKLVLGVVIIFALFSLGLYLDVDEKMYNAVFKSSPESSYVSAKAAKSLKAKKSKKDKSSSKITKPQGTWSVVEKYTGPGSDGPFTLDNTANLADYAFEVTFKGKGFCTTHWTDPVDDSKPHCENSLNYNKDGTFIGDKDGRLQAWGAFMKFNPPYFEFYEGGMGYTKYLLEKKK